MSASSPSKPVRLAILGAGIFARENHLPALAALGPSVVQLVAVYSRSRASATAFALAAQSLLSLSAPPDVYHDEFEDPDDPPAAAGGSLDRLTARDDIDAELVVLPIPAQPAVVRAALAAGKHVLSEKPVAPDVKKGRELVREYEEKYKGKGLVWRVAENFETEPGYRAARKVVQEGRIGRLTFFSARSVNWMDEKSKWYNTPWRTVPEYQGGFLLDGGVHTIAALRVILGPSLAMSELSAHASLAKDILPPHDTIHAVVRTSPTGTGPTDATEKDTDTTAGAHGLVELTWGAPVPSRVARANNALVFTGTRGWLEVSRSSGNIVLALRTVSADGTGERAEVVEEPEVGVKGELASFFRAVRRARGEVVEGEGEEGVGDPRGTLADVAFIEAALGSGGKPVDLLALAAV